MGRAVLGIGELTEQASSGPSVTQVMKYITVDIMAQTRTRGPELQNPCCCEFTADRGCRCLPVSAVSCGDMTGRVVLRVGFDFDLLSCDHRRELV